VQMLFPLPGRTSVLKLTTSHYYLPGGTCIHREENSTTWGVDPDVVIEMTPEQMSKALDARSGLDVLRESDPNQPNDPLAVQAAQTAALGSDPQLTAAVLLLRLHLAGAPLM
jgi:carboxyl-terminal processing protease